MSIFHNQGVVELHRESIKVHDWHLYINIVVPFKHESIPVPTQQSSVSQKRDNSFLVRELQPRVEDTMQCELTLFVHIIELVNLRLCHESIEKSGIIMSSILCNFVAIERSRPVDVDLFESFVKLFIRNRSRVLEDIQVSHLFLRKLIDPIFVIGDDFFVWIIKSLHGYIVSEIILCHKHQIEINVTLLCWNCTSKTFQFSDRVGDRKFLISNEVGIKTAIHHRRIFCNRNLISAIHGKEQNGRRNRSVR
ncbi:hypothetical protein OGAPHI_003966 [Ogataea philodendri]|uniref:Uncharacterized protein n=1 Tax=Ogataea philodendri TaxID=1378263 RepID=A0A9P8T4B8_9ASCO|nr:uncharacterized protein OGAPHI_003966 [Ogataea philodendri]KAH3665778.1 hypothetical protein OGAPHI_003966 [Ogataea philodendri]